MKIPLVAVNVKTTKILSINVILDEYIHDSTQLLELIEENIIKSEYMSTTTTTTAIIYSVMMVLMKVMRFLSIWKTMEFCYVLK